MGRLFPTLYGCRLKSKSEPATVREVDRKVTKYHESDGANALRTYYTWSYLWSFYLVTWAVLEREIAAVRSV